MQTLTFDSIYNPDTFAKHFDNTEFEFKQMTKKCPKCGFLN